MKFFIIAVFLFLNASVHAETLYYKNINSSEESSNFMTVEFPEDCLEIKKISNDDSLEFKNQETIEKKNI